MDAGRVIYLLDTGVLHGIHTQLAVTTIDLTIKRFLAIELAFAKKNNDDLSVQVKEGFHTKRLHGQYPGPAPLGFINVIVRPGERNIAPDPVKGPLCVRICEMAATGTYQIEDLLKEARSMGLTSRRDKLLGKANTHRDA